MVTTVAERKAVKVARLRRASAAAMERLAAYASINEGRYLVFGSTARGELRFDSDFDVIVDFPKSSEREAKAFAEAVSREVGLVPDVHLLSEASTDLMARVRRDAIALP